MYQSLTKRKILAVCIAASLLSHVISILFLQQHSFWGISPKTTLPIVSLDKTEPDQILRESFVERSEIEGGKAEARELTFETASAPLLPLQIEPLKTAPISLPPIALSFDVERELSTSSLKPAIVLPPIQPFNLFEHLPKDLIVLESPLPPNEQHALTRVPKAPVSFSKHLTLERTPSLPTSFTQSLLTAPLPEAAFTPQALRAPAMPHLPEFPTLADLDTYSYSDSFETEIVFAPLPSGDGYVFALTLIPNPDLHLPKIRQHYTFLIDRSNSIQKERLSAVKAALLKALEELSIDDSFNIIAFDSKIDKLSPAPIPATPRSLQAAKAFLDEVQLGSFFSTSNLTKPLVMAVPSSPQDDAIHTAILFSDGEPLTKKAAQRELGLDWTAYNGGRLALFAIGVGGDQNLATLDAIAAFNRGKLSYPPTKRGIKRKLLKLMKTIGQPVAKNVAATAIARASQANIQLYPKAEEMPALYLNEPYVIMGTIDKLENFILFVQAKLKDRWLNIRKNISFVNAKKAEGSLKAELAIQQAYGLYAQYLRDLDPSHLAEAETLLEPYDLQTAFK